MINKEFIMKPFTPFQLKEHLKWLYTRPNYYKERGKNDNKRSRHNEGKNL